MRFLVLSRDDIARVELGPAEVMSSVRDAYRALAAGEASNPEKIKMTGADTVSYSMLGSSGDAVGFKTSFTHDPEPGRGTKNYFTTMSLYDEHTGAPLALLDGGRVGAMRTAAVTAILAATIARPDARTLLLIGTGTQAQQSVEPLLSALPDLNRVLIAGSHPTGLDKMRAIAESLDQSVSFVDAGEAAAEADVIVATAGPGGSQLAAGADFVPGSAAVLVGYGIDSDALWNADRVVATNEAQMRVTGTDMLAGREQLRSVDAELPDVLAGKAIAREHDTQRLFGYNSGLIVTDIAVATLVVARAREMGLGTEVDLW